MAKKLLYATSNPGKTEELKKLLSTKNINLYSPKDFDINIDPDETGNTLEENSNIKCEAFLSAIDDPNIIVMADDTGVEIDALDGEPGVHVRRWKGYRMDDEEIIAYCIERMKDVPVGERGAQFRTVITVGTEGRETKTFDGVLRGEIVEKPIKLRMEGFPFESIFYIPEYEMMLGDMHQLPSDEKEKRGLHSHRERALLNALDHIKTLLNE